MTAPSPAAVRMRRTRERRRQGDVIVSVEVTPALSSPGKVGFMLEIQHGTIETLIALRWLRTERRDDLAAIVTAFRCFVGRSLDIARNGGGVQ